jgi:twitching motility protein PilT
MANMHQLLKAMIEKGASDLHITTGTSPQLRIDGKLHPLRMPPLSPPETKQLCYSVLTDAQKHQFEETNELDLSFSVQKLSRFRGNVFVQRGNVSGAFRAIPFKIKTFEELGLPRVAGELAQKPRGLVLVTGPTGSGKSTTLATMIDKINTERNEHIVTIEDPIEYLHHHKGCVVNQREVGADTSSFKNALKYILRQDPDVVLIGEMRDLETIEAALTVAETGHLCFATLHTNSAVQTINRIVDVFPPYQQSQVRAQLSFVLEGVLCQALMPRANGPGRVMALEVMVQRGDPEPDPRGQDPPDLLGDAGGPGQVRDADDEPVPGERLSAAARRARRRDGPEPRRRGASQPHRQGTRSGGAGPASRREGLGA